MRKERGDNAKTKDLTTAKKKQLKWERIDYLNKTSGMEIKHGGQNRGGQRIRDEMDHIAQN